MINQPDTHALLTEARRVLLDSLAPELSGARRYEVLMIANAIGMAIREQEQFENRGTESADQRLSGFLADQTLPSEPGQEEVALARALRHRQISNDHRDLLPVLKGITEARLRINNPGYLK